MLITPFGLDAFSPAGVDVAAFRMIVHLIDGTYELFRHFYGARRFSKGEDPPFAAVIGVLNTVLQMLETGSTHIGVATDCVIESFRNDLWAGYKTGDGIEPALVAQFHPLEEALASMGVAVWPMVELEAGRPFPPPRELRLRTRPSKSLHLDSDKDLAQCVRGDRVVQVVEVGQIRNAEAVRAKFGVAPELIPDYLRSSATRPTATWPSGIGAVTPRATHQQARRAREFRPTCWAAIATSRCCLKISQHCERTRPCSATSTRSAGAATDALVPFAERIGAHRLWRSPGALAIALLLISSVP